MIHAARPFINKRVRNAFAGAIALSVTLSACAGGDKDYPSFAIPQANDDTGRVSMRFRSVVVPTQTAASAPMGALPQELDAALAAINRRAVAANTAFTANLDETRALVSAAQVSNPESDRWANAQIRLARLTSYHSDTHLALADLDQLAATASLAPSEPEAAAMIADLQNSLLDTVNTQAKMLNGINAQFDQ